MGACAALVGLVLAYHARAAAPGQAFVGDDLRNFFFAVREATAAALRAGHLPGWQRGIFMGYPLLADPQAAVLDPGTWLTLPWDAPRALTLAALLHLCVAGLGMILWARLRDLGPCEALLAAVIFALGAKQTVHLQHWNFAASTAWWPWMLAGLEGFAAADRAACPGAGRGAWLLLASGAAALSWLGGAAQMAYFGTLVACAYALVLAPRLWRRSRLDALLALVATPAGLLLAGPVVLPVVELAALGPRGAGVAYRFATSWKWPDRWGLALFLVPRAYGGRWILDEMNLWEATGYLGILPLALAFAAPLRRRALWVFAALGVVGIWLSFGEDALLGLHHAFYRFLPGYGSFRNPTRSLMVTLFASALLAAEAVAAMRSGELSRRGLRAGLVLAAVAAIAPLLARAPSFPLDVAAARGGARVAAGLAAVGLAWIAAGWALAHRPRLGGVWTLLACGLVFVDLHLAFGAMNPVAPAAGERAALRDLSPLVPAAPAPRRVAVLAKWGRTANAPLRNGWEGVTGYGPTVVQRVRTLLEATRDDRVAPPSAVEGDTNFPRPRPTSRLWPLLGASLVVSDDPIALPKLRELAPEWEKPTAAYVAEALPRVFWAGAWTTAADARVAAPLLDAARGDRVVLAPDAPLEALPTSGPPAGPVAASKVTVDGGTLEALVEAPRAGLAVVLDPWFPGWSATVDGRPAALVRADLAFMAVPCPAGRHVLRLSYRNAQVARGAALAAATLLALLGALALRGRRSAPAERDEPPVESERLAPGIR